MFTIIWAGVVLLSLLLGLALPFPARLVAATVVAIAAGVVMHPRQRWWKDVEESGPKPPLGRVRNVAVYGLAVAWMALGAAKGLFVAELSHL